MIPKDKIDDVLFAADLKKVAEDCGLKLRRAGAVLYKACCPFHNETDGSFFVNTNTNRWTCYGCDRSGNAIDLVMEKKGLSFPDAVKLLAAEHGITIEERQPTKEEEERERERSGQLIIHEEAAHFYQRRLKENLTALEYARSRFDDKTIETFRLGYAPREPSELYSHLRQKGFSIEALEKAGVAEIKALGEEFDPNFHNAVMMEETDEYESNKVSEVMQKGYTLNSRVIRPSMVKVAQ